MKLTKKESGIYLDKSISSKLNYVDSIIFDCDGVLIDIRNSYDQTIKKTTSYILEKFCNISNSLTIDEKIIDGFKATGGFNDEVDLTYAAILSLCAANKLNQDPQKFIFDVISNSNSTGIKSVEKYIEPLVDISEIKSILNFPGTHSDNFLYQIFDQIFYGPILYQKIFNRKSEFSENGLIENDLVIISDKLLETLQKQFKRITIVTGRGLESIRYSLKDLLDRFDLKNSMFLEDESRDLAKPNPEPLVRSISGISGTLSIFVGDSMEDLIMAKNATLQNHETIFCGIIGTSKSPEKKLELFEQNGAQLVLESINLLPKVLNLE